MTSKEPCDNCKKPMTDGFYSFIVNCNTAFFMCINCVETIGHDKIHEHLRNMMKEREAHKGK